MSRSQQLTFSLTNEIYLTTGETLVSSNPRRCGRLLARLLRLCLPWSSRRLRVLGFLPLHSWRYHPPACVPSGLEWTMSPFCQRGLLLGSILLVSVCGVGCSVCVQCYMSCCRVLFCVMYCRAPLSWCHMDYVCPVYFHLCSCLPARRTVHPRGPVERPITHWWQDRGLCPRRHAVVGRDPPVPARS